VWVFKIMKSTVQMTTVLLLSTILPLIIACSAQTQRIEADIVFENVNVVPMNEERISPHQMVAVRDGQIIAILDQAESDTIDADRRIEGNGRYLMPGLADMHIHMRMQPQALFNLALANGVTTIANMRLADGDGKVDHLQLRSDIASGVMTGPRYLVSGPMLTPDNLPSVDDIAPMLDQHVEARYDVVKIHADLDFDIYDALIKGARERGLRVTGHGQHQMPLAQTLRMDSIEHAEEFLYTSHEGFGDIAADFFEFMPTYFDHLERLNDPEYRAPIIRDVAASGTFIDPTLVIYSMIPVWVDDSQFEAHHADPRLIYIPQGTRDWYLGADTNPYRGEDFPLSAEHFEDNLEILNTLIFELNQAGVPLLLGSDSFGTLVPGFSAHRELELMVEAGLTPYQALRTGTVNVAAYLEESDHAGTLEVGKRADFILLSENPLIDITNARTVEGVYTQGVWHTQADLNVMLEEAATGNAEWN